VENHPEQFAEAVRIDEEIRDHNHNERNTKGGLLFLHHSKVPLKDADLDEVDRTKPERACSLGMCFV
jgi:hypothetical protein